jgi:hypothetical protein
VKSALSVALARHASTLADADVARLVALLCGCSGWSGLLDAWWSPSAPVDDLHLSAGYLAARRSRQLEVLCGSGIGQAPALSVLYEAHPTSAFAPDNIDAAAVDLEGFLVRDGMFVQLIERDGRWRVRDGLGHLGEGGSLVIDATYGDAGMFPVRWEAAEAACAILGRHVAELRERFFEKRSFFRFRSGRLFETPTGDMDTVEVVSEQIARAFMSGSSEAGCYVLAPSAADALPVFAVFEREADRRGFLDAEGMGLIVPMVFPDVFSADERRRAERLLAADHPLTYAVLAGGMLDRSNMSAVIMEWDDDHEPEDFPEYMIVEKLKSSGKSVVVMGILTDDALKGREVIDGHLFVMPAEDYRRHLPIDPGKHRKLQSENMAIKIVRPR